MNEEKSTEEQMQKIDAIVGDEALGYEGGAKEEITGQPTPPAGKKSDGLEDELADNRPGQVK